VSKLHLKREDSGDIVQRGFLNGHMKGASDVYWGSCGYKGKNWRGEVSVAQTGSV
jgi:hypothetical protein